MSLEPCPLPNLHLCRTSSPPLGSFPRLPRLPKLPLLRLLPLLSFLIRIRVDILLPAKLLAFVTAGIDGRSDPLESTLLHGLSCLLHTYDESSDVPLFCRLPGCNGPLSTRGPGGTRLECSEANGTRIKVHQFKQIHYNSTEYAYKL